ncbi:MAG: hypothetical protein GF317_08555 [Candidatus Lokiarchaeota archaeon]|nr:hypothetical protein [Candidatus Lokiarchaeota archaeon]MBD3199765.1 hypothetical protein [Candidatus Lokiarchaeota archaeon]
MTIHSEIEEVTIVGVGTMGREIAQVALLAGYPYVVINDIDKDSLEKAKAFIINGLTKLEEKGKLPINTTAKLLLNNLHEEQDLEKAVESSDIVIEAIPEILNLKQEFFKELSELTPKHTLLASNTSNMRITDIAKYSNKPDKIFGMHFFTPIILLRAIEIIKGEKTSSETIKKGKEFAKSLPALKGDRTIIYIEKETPGFIVNRLTGASSIYLNWLLENSKNFDTTYKEIDAQVVELQRGGLGPYAKWDYLGLDVVYHSFNYYAETLSPDFAPGERLKSLVKKGKLGKKTGEGFYEWTNNEKPILDLSKKSDLFDIELFMAIQLNEGCRLIQEGVVKGYKEIDKAVAAAMEMPGPFSAGKRNYKKWVELLNDFADKSGLEYLYPCELLRSGEFKNMRK